MNILSFIVKKIKIKKISWQKKSVIKSWVNEKSLKGMHNCIGKGVFICDNSEIDSYVLINNNVSIENAIIGKFCSIASGVNIGSYNHNYTKLSTHRFAYEKMYGFNVIKEKKEDEKLKIIIESDVWIGINSIILPGVKIARGSIVGAGAVVTKNIGEFEIWAGNPARYIKKRFSDEIVGYIKGLEWENFSEENLQKIVDLELDIEKIKHADI